MKGDDKSHVSCITTLPLLDLNPRKCLKEKEGNIGKGAPQTASCEGDKALAEERCDGMGQ